MFDCNCSHTLKSAQNCLVSDVLGLPTSCGFSSIIIALPSDPTETIVPAGDPAIKSSPSMQNRTVHTSKKKKKKKKKERKFKCYC